MNTYYCIVFAVLQRFLVITRGVSILEVSNVSTGEMAKFECTSPNADNTARFRVYKDTATVYDCIDITFPCRKSSPDPDYTNIAFTEFGGSEAKGTFTVTNANEIRDGGDWTCQFGSSSQSNGITFTVSDATTTAPTTTASTDSSNNESATTDTSTESSTSTDQTSPTKTYTDNSTPTYTSPAGVTDTSAHTTQLITILGLSEKQRIGLIAGGVGVVVVICCSICICAIIRRNVNKNKRRRIQERRKEVEVYAHISEAL